MTDVPSFPLDPFDVDDAASAATAMRRTADRLRASQADLDLVNAVLFAPLVTGSPSDPPALREGATLTADDRQRVRELLDTGLDISTIAKEVGCTTQVVTGINAARVKAARYAARQQTNA